jgi:uncharacterized protein YkwD
LGAKRATWSVIGALFAVALLSSVAALRARAATGRTRSEYCPGAETQPDPANSAAIDAATVCLINHVRTEHRLRPLRSNSSLQRVASSQVAEMVRVDYFADDRPSGQTPMALIASTRYAAHAAAVSVAQNIGWATRSDTTPLNMVAAWMKSPPHREVILTSGFRNVGVGVVSAVPSVLGQGRAGATYAVEFAARSAVRLALVARAGHGRPRHRPPRPDRLPS